MPLSTDDKKKYKDLYLQTAKPYVKDLQNIASYADTDSEKIDLIHRAAHSMGSQSLMMEYNSLGKLSRLIEKIFKSKKDEDYTITPETKVVLMKAVSRMNNSLAAIENDDNELDLSPEVNELQSVSKIVV
jgi:chemotaxis protein histidine kinase CheA